MVKLAVKNAFISLGNGIGLYHLLFLASHFGYVSEFRLKLDFHVNSSVAKNFNLQDFLTCTIYFFSKFPRKNIFFLVSESVRYFFPNSSNPPPQKSNGPPLTASVFGWPDPNTGIDQSALA